MIVTGAFLADHAEVVDGKLNVRGGVLESFTRTDPTTQDSIAPLLVVLTQAEPGDTTTSVLVEIHSPTGTTWSGNLQVPEITRSGTESGFFFERIQFPTPVDGRYVIVVGSVSIPVWIRTSTP